MHGSGLSPLTSIPYNFPSVEHCICNLLCEMFTPSSNTSVYNSFSMSAGILCYVGETQTIVCVSPTALLSFSTFTLHYLQACVSVFSHNQQWSCFGVTGDLQVFVT